MFSFYSCAFACSQISDYITTQTYILFNENVGSENSSWRVVVQSVTTRHPPLNAMALSTWYEAASEKSFYPFRICTSLHEKKRPVDGFFPPLSLLHFPIALSDDWYALVTYVPQRPFGLQCCRLSPFRWGLWQFFFLFPMDVPLVWLLASACSLLREPILAFAGWPAILNAEASCCTFCLMRSVYLSCQSDSFYCCNCLYYCRQAKRPTAPRPAASTTLLLSKSYYLV